MIGQRGLLKWKLEHDPIEKYFKILMEHNTDIWKDIKKYTDKYYELHPEEKPIQQPIIPSVDETPKEIHVKSTLWKL